MEKKKMSIREKLELMKEIARRNEERRKKFAKQQDRNKKLFDMFERGDISEEEFFRYYKTWEKEPGAFCLRLFSGNKFSE